MAGGQTAAVARLEEDRQVLARESTAGRVADILRTRITEGMFRPGERLPEVSICKSLGVSRNTLREAFRLLTHERLLEHHINRGLFVKDFSAAELDDIFRLRATLGVAALRSLTAEPPWPLAPLERALEQGAQASAARDEQALITANMRFHAALVALAGSPRFDNVMCGLMAEVRLAFHALETTFAFHEPYLAHNRRIYESLRAQDAVGAERHLERYLDESRRQLLARNAQDAGA
ncbi:GntR family transcriptional regulator [Streptomyces sp. ISL-96]|uniref:GntR family transcriptional regulator n=1 Tax=Streptomyces sp. ISL-96 TaxID=2819191 RepID=UPI001BEB2425|nr:GntR family transcriptional regulator [Streptomyces sp. ISL-96]MBT2493593.1 GntR family transcriptional regulator [Streptomyces sp. ISL-96]